MSLALSEWQQPTPKEGIMVDYVWDLGFDFNAVQNADNTYNLAMGLADLSKSSLGNPLSLKVGDTISVKAFNLTDGATTEGYTVTNVQLNFTKADKGQPGSPYPFSNMAVIQGAGDNPSTGPFTFNVNPTVDATCGVIQLPPLGQPAGEAGSLIFQAQPEFPFWEVITSDMALANEGTFNLSISMVVQGPEEGEQPTVPRTFFSDPEMIVEAPPTPET
jgi:hypothetical protein